LVTRFSGSTYVLAASLADRDGSGPVCTRNPQYTSRQAQTKDGVAIGEAARHAAQQAIKRVHAEATSARVQRAHVRDR
jgi:hypothetical protein